MEPFVVEDWIDQLVPALVELAKVQKPYLQNYYRGHFDMSIMHGGHDNEAQAFMLDEARMLYARSRIAHFYGQEEHFAPLSKALDSVRHVLISHPTLDRVFGRIIGRDEFYMGTLSSGGEISPADLVAGLFARAQELEGNDLRAAAGELHAFLSRSEEDRVPGEIGVAYDVVLIWGLTLTEKIELADGVRLLPFKEIEAYVDAEVAHKYAPSFAGIHQWQSVGAIVRPFRWKPEFRLAGRLYDEVRPDRSRMFFDEVQAFLELLSVAHETPVLFLVAMADCIHASAGRLLGRSAPSRSFQRGRSVEEFDGFAKCPDLDRRALADANEAFKHRHRESRKRMAPIIHRLAEALARDRRFAGADRILDVAIALEYMYPLEPRGISKQLQQQVSQLLGDNEESQHRYSENVKEFYKVRSLIIHSEWEELTGKRTRQAFAKGFEIARKTLFKHLCEGASKDRDKQKDAAVRTTVRGHDAVHPSGLAAG